MRLIIGCGLAMIFSTSCAYAQSYVPDDGQGVKMSASAEVDYGALVYAEIFGHPPQRSAVEEPKPVSEDQPGNDETKAKTAPRKPASRLASTAERAADAAVEVVADIERALGSDLTIDRDYSREVLDVTFLPAREPDLPGGRNGTGIFLPRKLERVEVPASSVAQNTERQEEDFGG